MANEVTVPLLPCRSIDEIGEFYQSLGFRITYRQQRPNPYLAVQLEDIDLHFFGMPDFDPADSYGSCLVYVPDIGALYESFAQGMRAAHGKLLVSGIPRMTRPRKRKNADNLSGFSVVDPGGNWIRIFQSPTKDDALPAEPLSKLARTLQNAIVLGESKGDHQQAARILDATLARSDGSESLRDLVEVLVYRAEVAVVLRDNQRANELLARLRSMDLPESDRDQLAEALDNATELERVLRTETV